MFKARKKMVLNLALIWISPFSRTIIIPIPISQISKNPETYKKNFQDNVRKIAKGFYLSLNHKLL